MINFLTFDYQKNSNKHWQKAHLACTSFGRRFVGVAASSVAAVAWGGVCMRGEGGGSCLGEPSSLECEE